MICYGVKGTKPDMPAFKDVDGIDATSNYWC